MHRRIHGSLKGQLGVKSCLSCSLACGTSEPKTLLNRASKLDYDVCSAQTEVLPKGAGTQSPARYPWARPRSCPFSNPRRGLRAISARAQEDRNAACALKAYPTARSASTRAPCLAAIAQNLRRLASVVARRPPPALFGSADRVSWELRREHQGPHIKAGRVQPDA
jgi:hypothetical protein